MFQAYYIKREAQFSGTKLSRLMDQNEKMVNNIRDISIVMNKGIVTEDNINMYCDESKLFFTETDHAYCCMRTLKITD